MKTNFDKIKFIFYFFSLVIFEFPRKITCEIRVMARKVHTVINILYIYININIEREKDMLHKTIGQLKKKRKNQF